MINLANDRMSPLILADFKAAASGTNLKNYIESLLEKEVKPMTNNTLFNRE